jgi:uncharacterized protein (DUF302 family)
MNRFLPLLIFLVWITPAGAEPSTVLVWETGKNLELSYKQVYKALEDNKFFVVFEPDIQRNLSGFAKRWGENYNRSKLEGIRAMVFCNAWYANEVSNTEPNMMALCPLHITLIQKDGKTRILFVRPSVVAKGSGAEAVAKELEADVSKAIEQAVAQLK